MPAQCTTRRLVDYSTVEYNDVGSLYDAKCCEICGAWAFKDEMSKSLSQPGKRRGRSSCCVYGALRE